MLTKFKERDYYRERCEILERFAKMIANLDVEPKKSHLWFIGQALLVVQTLESHHRSWENLISKHYGGATK